MKTPDSVRGRKHTRRDPGERLDQTPLELPMGARVEKGQTIADQIQTQIAIQLAKKKPG